MRSILFLCASTLFVSAAFLCGAVEPVSAPVTPATPTVSSSHSAVIHPHIIISTTKGVITAELYPEECPLTVANFIGLAEGSKSFTDNSGTVVKRPFYDGLTFHRVIAGFMIQGGCPKGDGTGGPGFSFADEINADAIGLDRERLLINMEFNPLCQYQAQDAFKLVIWPRMQEAGVTPSSTPAERMKSMTVVQEKLKDFSLKEFYYKLGYRYNAALPGSHKPLRGSLAMANSGPNTNGSQFFINLADTPHLAGKHTVFGAVISGMEVVDAIGAVATDGAKKPLSSIILTSIRLAQSVSSPMPGPQIKQHLHQNCHLKSFIGSSWGIMCFW